MRPIRSISVLVPTWQGMEFLERVLAALAAQVVELPWDLSVVDSGSTDGTWERLLAERERFPVPLSLARIEAQDFDHGDTRNELAARSRGDLLVYLTQDAIPAGARWLATLAGRFEDPTVGAAYCRNVPRPDARPATRVLCQGDPGYAAQGRLVRLPDRATYARLDPHERRLLYNFNDVASALRRELWERHPFPRTPFGEDVLMARALLEAGYGIVYDAEATVEHSHDYGERETYARAFVDGRFNAEWLDRTCVASESDAEALVRRLGREDAKAVGALALERERERALLVETERLRRAAFLGLAAGGRSARRRPATRLRERSELSLLYVVHGFPPDTWAGTEVYTLNLAREMQERGHAVTVLARTGARSPDEADFDLVEERFEGLRVVRLVHRLEHARLRDSYRQPRAEAAFRRFLAGESFDLVHFQHLIHTSVGLVEVARQRGLATVLTAHDYWALCARVQLVRPDGQRCPGNMGSGCLLCVKQEHLERVAHGPRLDAAAGPLLAGFARDLARDERAAPRARRRAAEYVDLREREREVPEAYAACDLVISPSRFLRRLHLESGRFDPERFLYSDNGMRTDNVRALRKLPRPEGRVRFGFVGSLVWYKGPELLVRAARLLADAPIEVAVHGDFRPERDPFHAELARAAEGTRVRFHGRFDNARLSEVYASIDVLVVPSLWYENSPITIHEAFLTRTPVVAGDLGGMAEYVREGVDGLRFRVGDAADLAAKMRRFVREPDLLARLSRDFPTVKTIEENAAELEFRYRALCCRVRPAAGLVFESAGSELVLREGPVEQQGREWLLLRPGGSAVEVDLAGIPRGATELELSVAALGSEPWTEHGGRVLVDGREVGRLPLLRTQGEDRLEHLRLRFDLSPTDRRLRVVTSIEAGGPEASLRIAALRLWALGCAEEVPA